MTNDNVDIVIKRFYSYLPNGKYYCESVSNLNLEIKEQQEILKFLVDESIIKDVGDQSHILSSKGKEIVEIYGGIDKYLEHEKSEKDESNRLEKLKNEKLYLDTKLAKWKVKTFWYVFIFGLLGGFHTVYSIIDSFVGESEEQKIERILENKLQEREQKQKASIYQTNIDTLAKKKSGEK